MEPIQNKVADSPIRVVNLEEILGTIRVEEFDIAEHLEGGFILREKAFRKSIAEHDFSQNTGNHLAVHCSSDAIIPTWVYMLVASSARDFVESVLVGKKDAVRDAVVVNRLRQTDWAEYQDLIVVLKGCGSSVVPPSAFAEATVQLQAVASKIMYGEPCSSVHVWRRSGKKSAERSASGSNRSTQSGPPGSKPASADPAAVKAAAVSASLPTSDK